MKTVSNCLRETLFAMSCVFQKEKVADHSPRRTLLLSLALVLVNCTIHAADEQIKEMEVLAEIGQIAAPQGPCVTCDSEEVEDPINLEFGERCTDEGAGCINDDGEDGSCYTTKRVAGSYLKLSCECLTTP